MTGTLAGKNPTPGQTHLRAVNRAIRSAGAALTDLDDPLVETLRTLARQMDDSGPNPSTRLTAAYLSAQRDLARALSATRAKPRGPNKFDELKARRAEREAG